MVNHLGIRYLLDTNILIALLRGSGDNVREKLEDNEGRLAISTITLMELEDGASRSNSPKTSHTAIDEITSQLHILDFDKAAAQQAGEIRAALTKAGTPIGPFDTLIAGHARSKGLIVVTTNFKEFSRVRGLLVENWLPDPLTATP